jgi:murein L,D-transpeptidase YcbB/YkuD
VTGFGRLRAALATVLVFGVVGPTRAGTEPVAAVIRRVADAGVHPDLRWPRFPDYQRHVRRLYETVAFQPIWLRDGRPTRQAGEVIAVFQDAGSRGLGPADYDTERWQAQMVRLSGANQVTPEELGLFETGLTVSAMRYASDAYIGRINPHRVGFGLDVEPKKLDLARFLVDLAASDAPRPRLVALDPPFPTFARFQSALARMRGLAARTDMPAMPVLPTLAPNEADAGVPALRRWLVALGDLAEDVPVPENATFYDPALAAAVRRYQRRHGRDADGVIGRTTQRALRVPLTYRVQQVELAMERLRWLPATFQGRFVVVNIPEFRLLGFESGMQQPLVEMEVVVGSAAQRTETPIMHADMRWVVFRPYWNVPPQIAKKETLPRVTRDPEYLVRENMEIVDGQVRQLPGQNNALGLVKFIFPNEFDVYLHDTPSKDLFARSRRDFSHGCIRVGDPVALAEFVLRWDRTRITDAMSAGRDDRWVGLPKQVPVYLLYTTAVVEEDGQISFFDDIYGHDATLRRELAKGYPYPA